MPTIWTSDQELSTRFIISSSQIETKLNVLAVMRGDIWPNNVPMEIGKDSWIVIDAEGRDISTRNARNDPIINSMASF